MALDSTRQWSILSVSGLLQAINVFSITFKRFRLIKHDSLQIKLYSAGTSSTLLLKYSNSQWRIVHKWREAAISAAWISILYKLSFILPAHHLHCCWSTVIHNGGSCTNGERLRSRQKKRKKKKVYSGSLAEKIGSVGRQNLFFL